MIKTRIPATRRINVDPDGGEDFRLKGYNVVDYSQIPDDLKFDVLKAQIVDAPFCKAGKGGRYLEGGVFRRTISKESIKASTLRYVISAVAVSCFVNFVLFSHSPHLVLNLFCGFLGSIIAMVSIDFGAARSFTVQPVDVRPAIVERIGAFSEVPHPKHNAKANYIAQSLKRRLQEEYRSVSPICQDPVFWGKVSKFLSTIVELNHVRPRMDKDFLASEKREKLVQENIIFGESLLAQLEAKDFGKIEKNRALQKAVSSSANALDSNLIGFSEPKDLILDYSPIENYIPYEPPKETPPKNSTSSSSEILEKEIP